EPGPAARRLPDAARDARAPLPPLRAPAPERRRRRVGARACRLRSRAGARARAGTSHRRPRRHASARRAPAVDRHVLRLARASHLRRGARTPGDAPPPRARHLLRGRGLDVVADRARPLDRRCESALRLRGVRVGLAARAAARAPSASRLSVLRARTAPVGRSPHGPADRRPNDGGGTGRRILRGLRVLPRAIPAQRGDRGRLSFSTMSPSWSSQPEQRTTRLVQQTAILLGVALVAWIVTVDRMSGMDLGPGTNLGGLGWYLGIWVTMMAAMMLPSAAPMVVLFDRVSEEKAR